MIEGTRTAAEAVLLRQIHTAPNSIGRKILAKMEDLTKWQNDNPTASEYIPPKPIQIPTAALASITAIWGAYVLTTNTIPKPLEYNGSINNWSQITKISWP